MPRSRIVLGRPWCGKPLKLRNPWAINTKILGRPSGAADRIPGPVRQRHPRARGRTRRRTACREGQARAAGAGAGGQKRVRFGGQAAAKERAVQRPGLRRPGCAGLPSAERPDRPIARWMPGRLRSWMRLRRARVRARAISDRRSRDRRSLAGPAITDRDICPAVQGRPPPLPPAQGSMHTEAPMHGPSRLMMPSASHLSI